MAGALNLVLEIIEELAELWQRLLGAGHDAPANRLCGPDGRGESDAALSRPARVWSSSFLWTFQARVVIVFKFLERLHCLPRLPAPATVISSEM
jgi:hypothetical protein